MQRDKLKRLCKRQGVALYDQERAVIIKAPKGKVFKTAMLQEVGISNIPTGCKELAYDQLAVMLNDGLVDAKQAVT